MNKNWKKWISITLAFILILAFFSGCQKKENNSNSSIEGTTSNSAEKENAFTVTDQIGRQVEIKGEVNKIVSSYYISTSLLIALGLKDKVVGIEMKADTREIYKRAAPEFLQLPAIGSGKGVNVEEVAALEPDLVLLPFKLKDSVEQFEALNIPVLVIDPESMENFIACIELISKAAGREQRGNELIAYYQKTMEEVQNKTKDLTEKPKVYLSAGSDYLNTCTSKMYQNDLIAMAGGINVSAGLTEGYWQTISAEELLKWNPDVIFMVSYAEYTKEDIQKDSRLAEVNAVKTDEIVSFPSKLEPWDYPTPSSVLGILWLTSQLHPELYSKEDYIQEAKQFYQNYFDIEVTQEDMGY